jgi:hypothetical protein
VRLGGAESPRPSAPSGNDRSVGTVLVPSWCRGRRLAPGRANALRPHLRAAESLSGARLLVFGSSRSGSEPSLRCSGSLPWVSAGGRSTFSGLESGAQAHRPGAGRWCLRVARAAPRSSFAQGRKWYSPAVLREPVVLPGRWASGGSRAVARGPSNPSLERAQKARRSAQSR